MTTTDRDQPNSFQGENKDEDGLSLGDNVLLIRQSDVVITDQLGARPIRPRSLLAEAEALRDLAGLVASNPHAAIQRALELAVALCDAGSAGLSILDHGTGGDPLFRWEAIAGPLDCHVGGTTPRDFSPCGLCLDAGRTILVGQPFAVFAYFNEARRPLLEGVVTPLYESGDTPLGTLWVVHHDVTKRFDAEDARVAEAIAAQMTLALKRRRESPAAAEREPEAPRPAREGRRGPGGNPFVRKLSAYARLSEADKALLEAVSAEPRLVPARANLIAEGEQPGGVFLVMEGMACRYKLRATGGRQVTAYLLPGDSCDLDVALLRKMDHAIATVLPSRVARIPRETILDLTRNHPAIAKALRTATLVDEATLREWLVNIGCRSALERIAHLLCELLLRLQVVGLASEDAYDLPITQIDLADTTGLSNVHVNRTIQELRRRRLIALSGRSLRILDLPKLKALAEFRPAYLHLGEAVNPGEPSHPGAAGA